MTETETRLRTWRIGAGYSLQDVADLTGVSTAMWSRAERRLRKFTPATKALIARRLGVRIGDLFEVEELGPDLVAAEVAGD